MLIEVDGLNEHWEQGVPSDWQMMDGNDEEMPNAIHKLNHPSTQRMGDLSGIGYGNDYDGNMYDDDENIEKILHNVKWPRRNKT